MLKVDTLQEWVFSKKIFADDEYISDGTICIKKDKIDPYQSGNPFECEKVERVISSLNTNDVSPMKLVPFEKGEQIDLPDVVELGSSQELFFHVEREGKIIPFNYEKIKQMYLYLDVEYLTIVNKYYLKFWNDEDEFLGCIMGCILRE